METSPPDCRRAVEDRGWFLSRGDFYLRRRRRLIESSQNHCKQQALHYGPRFNSRQVYEALKKSKLSFEPNPGSVATFASRARPSKLADRKSTPPRRRHWDTSAYRAANRSRAYRVLARK